MVLFGRGLRTFGDVWRARFSRNPQIFGLGKMVPPLLQNRPSGRRAQARPQTAPQADWFPNQCRPTKHAVPGLEAPMHPARRKASGREAWRSTSIRPTWVIGVPTGGRDSRNESVDITRSSDEGATCRKPGRKNVGSVLV